MCIYLEYNIILKVIIGTHLRALKKLSESEELRQINQAVIKE